MSRAVTSAVVVALALCVGLAATAQAAARRAPLRVLSTQVSGLKVSMRVATSPSAMCTLRVHRGSHRRQLGTFAANRSGRITILATIAGPGKPKLKGSCVRSRAARTPSDYHKPHSQQDADDAPQVPAVEGDGQGASLADVEGAVGWALAQQGRRDYNWWCLRFVANAYGSPAAYYNNPRELGASLGVQGRGQSPASAPRGSLMLFAAAADNGYNGHVGISLGDGRMIDAQSVVKITSVSGNYWGSRYLGWTPPPARWPGRPSTPAPTLPTTPSTPQTPPATPTAPSTPPQTQPQHVFHVHNTCRDGACGLIVRNSPFTNTGGRIGVLSDGTAVNIRCQTVGTMISGGEGSNDVWDQIDYGGGTGYVSDLYMATPGGDVPQPHRHFSAGIPRC